MRDIPREVYIAASVAGVTTGLSALIGVEALGLSGDFMDASKDYFRSYLNLSYVASENLSMICRLGLDGTAAAFGTLVGAGLISQFFVRNPRIKINQRE
jgi:hypothetical protein